jgi:DNA (cytosine-5)-methyltransferase 3A
VGKLDEFGTYKKVEIPQPEDMGILLKDILEENVDERYNVHSDNWRISRNTRDKESKSRCLNASNFKGALNDGMTLVLNNDGTEKLKSNTIRTSGHRSGIDDKHKLDTIRIGSLNSGGQGDRVYSPNGKATTLSANGGGRGAKTGLYAVAQRGRNIVNGKRKDILGAKTEQRIEIGQSEKAHTITSVFKDSMIMENSIIRKLTPIECLRLQSMPDDYFDKAIYKGKPISNSQRYKMAGNAFNCKVVEHIIKRLN